jgi:pSer/pThr/pTyr-binding forkhead associated (FHA) protein
MEMYDDEPTIMGQARPSATLIIRQGPQAGMSFPLTGNQVIIGREEGLDIALQDPESSRRHAQVSWQGDYFVLEDLGSTNGTFVNGLQITSPQVLNPGDSIGVGQTALVFQVAGAQMGAPQYQAPAPHAAPQAEAPVVVTSDDGSKRTQYILYGCGCLLLLCICALLAVAAFALIDPDTFRDWTGLDISMKIIQTYSDTI